MTDKALNIENLDLEDRYPEFVLKDERKGYDGYIVNTRDLIEFASNLRDEYGYDFLSSVLHLWGGF